MKKTILTIATTLLLTTGLRAQNSDCDILTTPWSENFSNAANLACWTMLDYDGSTISEWMRTSLRAASGDGYSMLAYHTNQNCNDWMVTPVIQLPADSDGLVLTYEYYSVSSFNDYGEILIRVAPYGISGDIPEVDTAHFDAPLRLEHQGTNDFEHRGVSLANYAGQRVRIAFVQVGQHESNDFIDNVQVKSTMVPKVRLEAPARSHAWENTTVDAFLYEGSLQGLSFTWHSSLLDSSFSVSNSQLPIVYTFAGIDTVTCIASNIYGSDTAQIVIDVVDCSTVLRYPWKEDFEHGLDCWYQLGGWSAYHGIRGYDGGYDLRSNSSQSYGSEGSFWIISQPFAMPDTLMMPELMWWMRTPSQYEDNQNQFSLRIAVVDSTEMPSEDDFTTVMSRTMYYGGWERFRFPLDAYAGQTVRFMFYNYPSHSGYGYYDCVLIDQMEVRSTRQPVVIIDAPIVAERIDSVLYTVVLDEGDTTGIVYTWHSTLLDSTWTLDHAGPQIVSYPVSGIDTVTVIATNSYGIDTATAIVTVNECPALVLPVALFDFEDSTQLNCWSGFVANYNNDALASSVNTWYRAGNATNHYMTPGVDLAWLVSPAIDLPTDTSDLRLEWYQSGDRLGVFVSTDSNLFFEPADFPHTIQSISDAESFQNGRHSYSLAAFAGQRIHIAFCGVWASNLQLDDIHIASGYHVAPVATLTAPDSAMVGQTVSVSATLNVCSQRNIAYQWHSSLKGTTISASTLSPFTLTYETPGIDTVTLIVSNYYGADTQQVVVVVEGCSAVAAPWSEDFEGVPAAGSNVQGNLPPCWDFTWNGSNSAYAPHVIANGGYQYISNIPSHAILFVAGNSTGYGYQAEVLLPPFGDSLQNLSIAFDYRFESTGQGSLTVGYYDGNDNFTAVQTMAPHAGNYRRDTVDFASVVDPGNARIALRWNCNTSWYAAIVDNIEVFTDPVHLSEPVVTISGPTNVALDDTVLFTANLLRGDTAGITYIWHSSLLDTTTTLSSPHFSLAYPFRGIDTISVITTNAYGTTTTVSVVYVDTTVIAPLPNPMPLCDSPVTGIPWLETFAGGDDCWYKPAGSNWNDVIPYGDPSLEYMRYLYLQMQTDQQGSWIMSKGIQIPADTAVAPRLYWKVASNRSDYSLHYGVLVTTSDDFTDTANYTEIYYDGATHNQWSNYQQLSVSLAQYAGQTIHIAFHNYPNMAPSYDRCVCIDDVEIRGNVPPIVELEAPDSVNSGTNTLIVANVTGPTDNLSFTWHSSLLNSTWTTIDNSANIIYPTAGTDTLSVIASNSFGADTDVVIIQVISCGYTAIPYTEDFEEVLATGAGVGGNLPTCWISSWNGSNMAYAPHVIANGGYSYISNIPDNALFMVAGSSTGYDTLAEVILPSFAANLQTISLAFDYRFETVGQGNLEVGYYDAGGGFTSIQSMTPHASSYRRDTVSFASANFSDGLVALRWTCGTVYYAVTVDNIEVFSEDSTAMILTGPSTVSAYDSATYSALIPGSDSTGITYSWHSTLLDTTLSLPTPHLVLVYDRAGVDTLTVVATSATYSDTASKVVNVTGLPEIIIQGPTVPRVGENTTFVAVFVGGIDTATTYIWHSTLLDTTIILDSNTLTLNYPIGGEDTLVATVATLLGSTTVRRVINVVGCSDAVLPWKETFADGDDCWYKPAGSNWNDVIPYGDPSLEHMRYLYLQMQSDQQGSWIMSKGIQIPADTAVHPRLYWKVASNTNYYNLHYGVLVTTSNDYTDTANYTEIYYDGATHNQWSNYQQLSVSLAQFAGQTIHIAFHNYPNMAPSYDRCVCIDDVEIRGLMAPIITLVAPDTVNSGRDVQFVTTLTESSTTGLSYTWHSTLLDTTITTTANLLTLNYPFGGTDIVTVVASNIYGSATASAVVEVIDCSPRTLPWVEDFEGVPATNYNVSGQLPLCWTSIFNGSNAVYAPHVITTGGYSYFSPALPNHVLFMIAGNSSYGNSALVTLPSFADSLQNLSFAFDHLYESNNHGTLEVGYYNDNTLFTTVQTITPHTNNFLRDTVSFANVSVPDGLIALRWSNGTAYFAVAIDNIEVFSNTVVIPPDTVWRTVTLAVNDTAMGTASGAGVYEDSSLVTLAATPYEGYHFVEWSDNDTNAVRQVLVTSDTAFTAYFAQDSLPTPPPPDTVWRTVTLAVNDTAMGTVSGAGVYEDSSLVTLAATAYEGYHFVEWSDNDTNAVRQVLLTSDSALTAYFAADSMPIPDTVWRTVTVLCDSTMGTVRGAGRYPDSTVVSLMAVPADGYRFAGWSTIPGYTVVVTDNPLTFTVVSDVSVTAFFEAVPPDTVWRTVTLTTDAPGACETYGSGRYVDGSTVEIGYRVVDTATVGGHWEFLGWSDGVNASPRNIVVTSDTTLIAMFQWVADTPEGIDQQPTANIQLSIYPNPATSDVTISVGEPSTITVIDLQGRTVVPDTPVNSTLIIQHSSLAPGPYFVRFSGASGTAIRKLIVK